MGILPNPVADLLRRADRTLGDVDGVLRNADATLSEVKVTLLQASSVLQILRDVVQELDARLVPVQRLPYIEEKVDVLGRELSDLLPTVRLLAARFPAEASEDQDRGA